MRFKSVGFGLLASLASVNAFAVTDLDMKISCSYVVTDYEETYPLGIPTGDEENNTTRIHEPAIEVSGRVYIANYKNHPEQPAEGEEPSEPVNENQVHVLIVRVVKDADGNNQSKVAGRGTFSLDGNNTEFRINEQGEGFNNYVSCRYLTKEEIDKRTQEKEDARKAEEERKKKEEQELAEYEREQAEIQKHLDEEWLKEASEQQPLAPSDNSSF